MYLMVFGYPKIQLMRYCQLCHTNHDGLGLLDDLNRCQSRSTKLTKSNIFIDSKFRR